MRDFLVRFHDGRGAMPRLSIWLIDEAFGESTVSGASLLPTCRLADRGPYERMAESQHVVRRLHQARGDSRREVVIGDRRIDQARRAKDLSRVVPIVNCRDEQQRAGTGWLVSRVVKASSNLRVRRNCA